MPFLGSAVDERADGDTRADIETAYSLGAHEFVGTGTQQIDIHPVHIQRNLSQSLHSVSVE